MKKTLLTLGAVALLATPSLFAAEESLQQHLRMEQKLQKEYQKRVKDGSGEKNQYKYNYQKQYEYKGANPNRSNTGSLGGQRGGGSGRR
ncbi:hypothetical protein [Sulfurovum sp. TSL1]|uniref:hypothetical protein n=1 Tax=Sulfurovum sp. TSL1 TaxID=2826994 RepID=UPI001CC4431E|nr:hypothetical protein [Sulfurovum sp. TSL1]GIT97802.1 hypothetical protein TSL1_06230 [Sulfurovum sp. TSL1]